MTESLGRQRIGVDQPPSGGSNYPFIKPSNDIEDLLGDFYLSYKDDKCEFSYPFRIDWLYGFGSNPVSPPPDYPTPAHTYDIVVKDANDEVVFDSTTAASFETYEWGERLLIIEWIDESTETVCRCTKFLSWGSYSVDYQDYDEYIVPGLVSPANTYGGVLNPRTYNKLPLRVSKLRVGVTELSSNVTFEEGYNVSLVVDPDDFTVDDIDIDIADFIADNTGLTDAVRLNSRVELNATAGAGSGVFPGCEDSEPTISRLSGAIANSFGNVTLDTGTGCIRNQRPVGLVSSSPREFRYASFVLPSSKAPHAIELLNDCDACCECDYFARTYQGLKRQWFGYKGIAENGFSARDLHYDNIQRWNAEKLRRENDPFRLAAFVKPDCCVHIATAYGNTSGCCLVGNHVRFTVFLEGGDEEEQVFSECFDAEIEGSQHCNGPVAVGLPGGLSDDRRAAAFDASFDYLSSQDTARIAFKLKVLGCDSSVRIWFRADAYWSSSLVEPNTLTSCTYPVVTVPSDVEAVWTQAGLGIPSLDIRYSKESIERNLNSTSAFCNNCGCG